MIKKYIDFDLTKQYPNKHNFTPENIKHLRVLDWDRLKQIMWFNEATTPHRWCKLIGCQTDGEKYDDWDEFWIGIAENGNIDCYFTACENMCSYNFKEFYDLKDIEDECDMQVQVNVIKWLNEMIDEGILELPE